jgi:predicted DNA binding CopG/RHH family protein
MRYSPKKGYLNVYIPSHVIERFKAHCLKNGLTLSGTIGHLVEKYLKEGAEKCEKPESDKRMEKKNG